VSKWRIDVAAFGPALLVIACLVIGLWLESYRQYVVAVGVVSMVVGAALTIIVGLTRCITLASGAIMAIGAYTSTLMMHHLGAPYGLGLALSLVAGALAGWIIALPGVRFRGHNLAMVTLVFQSVCLILIRESTALTGGAQGIRVPPVDLLGWNIMTDGAFLIEICILSAAIIFIMTILVRGPFGKNLRAVADNEVSAEAFGINVPSYIRAAFIISSIAIAFAGALIAPRIRILDPDSFGIMMSINMLAYPIIGGLSSIWGGLIGGGSLRILPELLRRVADYQELFFTTLVIVFMMFAPGGLLQLLASVTKIFSQGGAKALEPSVLRLANTANVRFEETRAISWAKDTGKPLLVVRGVDKYFDALHAVNMATMTVDVGGIHGLIGPNGAGKTSLFNIISGFLDADGGSVEFAGTSLLGLEARDRIGLGITRTFQHVGVFGQLSLIENVIIGRGRNSVINSIRDSLDYFLGGSRAQISQKEALAALEAVGLANQAKWPAGALSLGDQRRLEIARAIVSKPRLILLDEPVSGLAESEVAELHSLLLRINFELDIAMLLVEHNIPFVAQLCRSMSVMGAGVIVAEGNPKDVIALPSVRQLYFGEDLQQ
jgi:branched-chain amino acid transport system permease protein